MSVALYNPRAFVVWWKDLDRWVNPNKLLAFDNLPSGWALAKVRDAVEQLRQASEVKPDHEYRMIGVKWYGEGTFHRETLRGSQISAKNLFKVRSGAFIYNRLFAWKASFAVVPPQHDNFYVSGEFPQFTVDSNRLLPEFLYLYFMTSKVIESVQAGSVGSAAVSRNRFKEDEFLDFLIPLPPLPIQQAIVEQWRQAQAAAAKSLETVAKLESEIQDGIIKNLGMRTSDDNPPLTKAFALSWQHLERWRRGIPCQETGGRIRGGEMQIRNAAFVALYKGAKRWHTLQKSQGILGWQNSMGIPKGYEIT